jgi:hypothetical protein
MAKIKLEQFENVGEDKTAILRTERLWPNTLEYIAIKMTPGGGGAITKANLEQIRFRIGTKTPWDVTGAQMNSINLFEGRTPTATVLILPFANSRARHLEQQYIGAPDFGALGVRKQDLEIKINGATDPFTLEAWAEVAPPKLLSAEQNALFRCLLRQPLSVSGAVVDAPQTINYGQGGGSLLRRMHFFSGAVTKVKIKRDGLDYYEDIDTVLNNAIQDENGWDPQANVFSMNVIEDDNELKALTSIRKDNAGGSLVPQQILMTTNGAATFDVVSDVFASLNGL